MIEKAIKILEFIVNIFTNIKNKYHDFRKKREQHSVDKNAKKVKAEVDAGEIDDLNKRLRR
jgi:hypothetical protein